MRVFGHLLDSPRTTRLAAFISLLLGLFFTFVWAPHPWTWEGIDQYHDLARALARGEGFNTTDVPWGYAYYVAFFYATFGEHPWLPILGQVIANATMPVMLYAIVRPLAGQRTAALSALILGVFSFNTVYASTQISDAICSVLFLAAVLAFYRAHASRHVGWFAASGLLLGLAAQFRPNLLLLPLVVAAGYVLVSIVRKAGTGAAVVRATVFVACGLLPVVPWVVRNYQLTGVFLPTSSHGAIQLWYGSLQVGPYLENFSENPRTVFAQAPFEYTSLVDTPIIVSIDPSGCDADVRERMALTYWTDRDPTATTLRVEGREARIPGQPDGTTVYWRIEPSARAAPPFVYFVSTAHTADLDRHDDFLDIFDVIRRIERDDPGTRELAHAVRVPRPFSGDLTDVEIEPSAARGLLEPRHRIVNGAMTDAQAVPECLEGRTRVNDVFYRRELHQMRRYTALALDNIRREPLAFAAASAYRSIRLFVVRPGGDGNTTYRFANAPLVYLGALLLSLTYFFLFLAGVAMAWRQRSPLLAFLVPIVYVPLTICFVLTNQRYSVTVQPLMFAFVALAIVTWWEKKSVPGFAELGAETGGR